MIRNILILLLLFLSGCGFIGPGGSTTPGTPMWPFTNPIQVSPIATQQMAPVQGSPFIVYANSDQWIHVISFTESYEPFSITFSPSVPRPSSIPSGQELSVAQNNVLSMCYKFNDKTSADSINSLIGSGDINGNCTNVATNPITQGNDCFGNLSSDPNLTQYLGDSSKLYLVYGQAFPISAIVSSDGIINNSCYQLQTTEPFAPEKFVTVPCPPPSCNNPCTNLNSQSVRSGIYPGPYMIEALLDSISPIIPINTPKLCPCENAYDNNSLNQEFIAGNCVFYNGMGVTLGYADYSNSNNVSLGSYGAKSITGQIFRANMGYQLFKDSALSSLFYSLGNSFCYSSEKPSISWLSANPQIMNNYLISELSGCYAVGGVPIGGDQTTNNGRLEYLLVPSGQSVSSVNVATGMISGKSVDSPFLNMTSSTSGKQDLYIRIHDSGSRNDNYGFYEISVYAYQNSTFDFIPDMVASVIEPIRDQVYAVSQQMFSNIVQNRNFINIINAMLTLYVVLFGISFLMGNTQITQKDLVYRLLKIGIVLSFMNSDYAQAFFNEYLLNLFWNGTMNLISYVSDTQLIQDQSSGQYTLDYRAIFGIVTSVLGFFFSSQFLTVMGILILWFPVGWIVIGFFIKNIFTFLNAVVITVVSMLIAFTAIALFIGLAPLFIVLVLFDQTRETFMNWLKVMTSFAFMPIIMFAGITMITKVILAVVYQLETMSLSLQPFFTFYVPLPWLKIPLFTVFWYFPAMGVINLIVIVLTLDILAQMLKAMPEFAGEISRNLFQTGVGGSAGRVDNLARTIVDDVKKPIGFDKATQNKIAEQDAGGKGNESSAAQSEGANRAKLK